jgi:hypothetical protein
VTIHPLRQQPEVMTGRARSYLAIAALRHLLIGGSCVVIPDTFRSSSFIPLKNILPLPVWGIVFLIAAATCIAAAIRRHDFLARMGLIMSATTTSVWAAGITLSLATGELSSPTGPIIWWAVALKDFIVCAQPMRSPFEPLIQAMRAEGVAQRRRT